MGIEALENEETNRYIKRREVKTLLFTGECVILIKHFRLGEWRKKDEIFQKSDWD